MSHPFRVLSLQKLIEHYFCLLDKKNLNTNQILKYLTGIQQLIQRKNLTAQFAVQLPKKFRDLFCLLVSWNEVSLSCYYGEEDNAEVDDEQLQSEEAEIDAIALLPFIKEHGCDWHPLVKV